MQSLYRTDKIESLGEALMILDIARGETMKRARHLQHPLFCLDAIRIGVEQGGLAGLQAVSPDLPICSDKLNFKTCRIFKTCRSHLATHLVGTDAPATPS